MQRQAWKVLFRINDSLARRFVENPTLTPTLYIAALYYQELKTCLANTGAPWHAIRYRYNLRSEISVQHYKYPDALAWELKPSMRLFYNARYSAVAEIMDAARVTSHSVMARVCVRVLCTLFVVVVSRNRKASWRLEEIQLEGGASTAKSSHLCFPSLCFPSRLPLASLFASYFPLLWLLSCYK